MDASIKKSLEKNTDENLQQLISYVGELEKKLERAETNLSRAHERLRKDYTAQLQPAAYSLQKLLFSLPGGVCLYDFRVNQLLAVDDQFCEMFGYPKDKIDNPLFFTIFPKVQPNGDDTGTALVDARNTAVETGYAQRLQLMFHHIDGSELPGEVTVVPNPHQEETVYLIFRDYSKSVSQQKALVESERRYREFIDLAPVGICKVDVYGRIELNSATADAMLGYDRGENLGTAILDLVHPDDRQIYTEKVAEMLAGSHQATFSRVRVRKKNGDYMWIRGGGKIHLDEAGIPQFVLVTFFDMNEVMQASALQQEREAIYKAVVRNAMEGIDIVDVTDYHPEKNPVGEIMIRNERMKRLFQSEDELFGSVEAISSIVSPFQPSGERSEDVFRRIIRRIYKQGKSKETFRLQHSENLYFDIEGTEQMIEIGGKKILIRVYYDITERLKQETLIQQQLTQLNDQNRELQTYIESNMQLENFAYIASHDLRAPIRSIVSFSNLLEKRLGDRLQASEKEYLDFIARSAVSMQMLIEDLLSFSRANTVKRQLERIPMNNFWEELQTDFLNQENKDKIHLKANFSEETIVADRIKLRQVLQNLINNASKFIPAERTPSVEVNLSTLPGEWLFSVQDNGIGIAEEFQETIFLIFKRLHNQEEYEGTGIGLALCKKLVEQHEGRIWVESTPGEGSTFYFTIRKDLAD